MVKRKSYGQKTDSVRISEIFCPCDNFFHKTPTAPKARFGVKRRVIKKRTLYMTFITSVLKNEVFKKNLINYFVFMTHKSNFYCVAVRDTSNGV
jgi:hypothetical protein